jgi:uncharacterized protein YqjF (DUF2071 family)
MERRRPALSGRWVMTQTWHDLLFAHWPVDRVRHLVPEPLEIDTFHGQAWVAVTPFGMRGVRLRGLPPLPFASAFPELNVRTYVTLNGTPGVYFFSLDAASAVAVAGARVAYGLPYHHARMTMRSVDAWITYASYRADGRATFRGRYRPVGPGFQAGPASLEAWLTERYSLYTLRRGRAYRADIDHAPWVLRPAEAELEENTMATAAGLELPATAPLLHFADRQDVVAGWPRRVP